MQITKEKLAVPALAVGLGLVFLAAQWVGGHPGDGFISLGIMVAMAALIALGAARSETIKAMRGDGRDERFAQIDMRATALAGFALIVAVLVAFAVEVARGHSGMPFAWLGAIAGVSYIVAIVAMTRRG